MSDTEVDLFHDPAWVIFGGRPQPEPGRAEEHGIFDPLARLVGRRVEDVQVDFQQTSEQLAQVVGALRSSVEGYEIDDITLSLGFSATGRLVFIAEAGIEATVSVTYKKKSTGSSQ